ncbi:outer membrane protein assembly factor BamB [Alteromonas sp. ASW11-130]|uniref:outer membrane protein assembly factor BamB n=1 Tax=Alteromonas sp. ASW11-130 TaxID=3015775 RepID=UPI0022426B78|nr:outer membrane protein assembly factor BamB [Alteromonas sp. ASW11-130]MCW8091352.1 outer membrane protein assembly factor BamB [Alteromonas sp. ASW11-130]
MFLTANSNKKLSVAGLLSLSLLLSGCSTISDWFADEEELEIRKLTPIEEKFTPTVVWEQEIGDGVEDYFSRLRPVYDNNKVFVAARRGEVAALNPLSGKVLWKKNFAKFNDEGMMDSISRLWSSGESAKLAGLSAADNMLFIGTEDGGVIALQQEDGALAWQTTVSGEVLAPPAIAEGVLLVNTGAGVLFGLDARTGEQKWRSESDVPPLTLRGISAPTAASGGAIIGTPTGKLQVNILESGIIAWETAVTTPAGATELERIVDIDSSPLLYGGIVYSIAYNGTLAAVELRSGRVIWKREYASYRNLTLSGNQIFVVDNNSHIYALDRRNGVELWSQNSLKHRSVTEAEPIEDYIVVGDKWGFLHWLEQETGKIVARYSLGGDDEDESIYVSPLTVEGNIIAVTREGKVAAIASK